MRIRCYLKILETLQSSGAGGPGDMVMTEKKHVANSFLDFDLG